MITGEFELISLENELYAVNDEKAEIEDWVLEKQPNSSNYELCHIFNEYVIANDLQKRIVASSNEKIKLPLLPKELQINSNSICLEMENFGDRKSYYCSSMADWRPKINEKGFVIILKK